jgi:hypothetical protein
MKVHKLVDRKVMVRSWKMWTDAINRIQDHKRLDMESMNRKSKIKALVNRIQELPPPVVATAKVLPAAKPTNPPVTSKTAVSSKKSPTGLSHHAKQNGIALLPQPAFEDSDSDLEMITMMEDLYELDIHAIAADQAFSPARLSSKYQQPSRSPSAYYSNSHDMPSLNMDDVEISRNGSATGSNKRGSLSRPSSARSIDSRKSPMRKSSSQKSASHSNSSPSYSSPTRSTSMRATSTTRATKPTAISQPQKPSTISVKVPMDFNARAQQRRDRIFQLQKAANDRHLKQRLIDEEEAR